MVRYKRALISPYYRQILQQYLLSLAKLKSKDPTKVVPNDFLTLYFWGKSKKLIIFASIIATLFKIVVILLFSNFKIRFYRVAVILPPLLGVDE